MFVVKEEYQKHQYSLDLKGHSDYQFILEIFLNNSNALVHIPKPLVNFRQGGISGQFSFFEELKEGFFARKKAGMNILGCVFALILRVITKPILYFKNGGTKHRLY